MTLKRINSKAVRLNAEAAAQGFVRIPYHADFNFAQAGDTEKPFSISLWVWPEGVITTGHPIISRFDAYSTSDQGPSNQKQTWRLIYATGNARGSGPTSGGAPIVQNGNKNTPWSSEAVPTKAMTFLLHDFANASGIGNSGYSARNRLRISTKTAIGADAHHQRWHHIAITYDGSKTRAGLKIYVNGKDDTIENDFLRVDNDDPATYLGAASFKGMDSTDQSDLVIGGYHDYRGVANENFQLGERYVADTCLFNKALSAAEVREIYSGVPGVQGTGRVVDMTKVSTYNNLISWWKMGDDEDGTGANQIKDYKSGHHGTLTPAGQIVQPVSPTFLETDTVQTSPPIKKNFYNKINHNSIVFDGSNDYICVKNSADRSKLSFGQDGATEKPFSISAWIFVKDVSADNTVGPIVTIANIPTGLNEYVFARTQRDEVLFFLYDSTTGSILRCSTNSSPLQDSTWHNIVVTYDGSKNENGIKIYVDTAIPGLTRVEAPVGYQKMRNNNDPLTIGGYFNYESNDRWFEDKLADICIFDKELTVAEVSEIYNNGNVKNMNRFSAYNNIISWWKMGDDADGFWVDGIKDYKGVNHGTMLNGPRITLEQFLGSDPK